MRKGSAASKCIAHSRALAKSCAHAKWSSFPQVAKLGSRIFHIRKRELASPALKGRSNAASSRSRHEVDHSRQAITARRGYYRLHGKTGRERVFNIFGLYISTCQHYSTENARKCFAVAVKVRKITRGVVRKNRNSQNVWRRAVRCRLQRG